MAERAPVAVLAVTTGRPLGQTPMTQQSGQAHGFFGILAEHGYERIDDSTARKGLIQITLSCHPPTLDLTVRPAHGYTWIPNGLRHISPLLTRPRDAAELAMTLGSDLLGDINRAQSALTNH